MPRGWTLFLDRDGVINRKAPEHEYITNWGEFEFLPGSLEAIRILHTLFDRIIVISNQRGIARGLIRPADLEEIHQRMVAEVREQGGDLTAILFCPHGLEDHCSCRKPEPGMAYQAKEIHPEISFERSVVIGDAMSDMGFAERIGAVGLFIGEPEAGCENRSFPSLLDAAKWFAERGTGSLSE